jgi:hypothetical protein
MTARLRGSEPGTQPPCPEWSKAVKCDWRWFSLEYRMFWRTSGSAHVPAHASLCPLERYVTGNTPFDRERHRPPWSLVDVFKNKR